MKDISLIAFIILNSFLLSGQTSKDYAIPVSREPSRDFDILHYKVELSVDLGQKKLAGKNTITMTPLRDDLHTIKLDAESLVVTGVSSGSRSLPFVQSHSQIIIDPGTNYDYGDTLVVTISYYLSKQIDGLRFIDALGDRPLQVSSNCFPNKARQWIPCFDYPNEKASQEMIITTDSKYKVLSNGALMSTSDNGNGTTTWYWKQDKPHPTYLINLSIADYLVVKDSLGKLPVNYWVYKSMSDDVERVFGKTPSMIEFYSTIFNYPFPWDKYDQVISAYMGGGAEATSATLLGEGIVTDKYTEQDYPREYVIAHEIAHQWWGDVITCRSWEHTWLNESFGSYSDYMYNLHDKGEDEGAYELLQKKNIYIDESHNRFMRPIVYMDYKEPGDNFNHHTYQKGACTLHLLRHILGDETFFRAISTFLHQHEFSPVSTSDFMQCIKDVSGENMDWFFEQYFYRPGHPVFNITKSWNESTKELTLTITQEQDKWKDVPVYTIPVRIGIHTDSEKIVKEYWLSKKNEEIIIHVDSKPLMVRFDDGNYLLKEWTFKKSLDELLYQSANDDMTGRLWAIEQLADFSEQDETVQRWKETAIIDDFWAVRAAAVRQIGKYHGAENIAFLKKAAGDKNSRVRTAAIIAMGSLEDPSLRKFYMQTFNKDNSYAVQSETLIALGKCGKQSDISFLKNAMKRESYRDVVKNAAENAINAISTKKEN